MGAFERLLLLALDVLDDEYMPDRGGGVAETTYTSAGAIEDVRVRAIARESDARARADVQKDGQAVNALWCETLRGHNRAHERAPRYFGSQLQVEWIKTPTFGIISVDGDSDVKLSRTGLVAQIAVVGLVACVQYRPGWCIS